MPNINLRWGVDSYSAANQQIRTPQSFVSSGEPNHQSLFEYVSRRVREPDFWGRYLNPYRYGITREEANYIFSASEGRCRILLVYNGPHRSAPDLIGRNAHRNGVLAATRAIQLASAIGARPSTMIYADLERWRAVTDWFRGWFETMATSRFLGVGGVYGNVQVQNRAEGWRDSFVQAITDLQSTGGNLKLASAYIWSNRPYLTRPGRDWAAADIFQSRFAPARVPANSGSETVIWQYGPNVPLGYRAPLVDLNMSTERGVKAMWSA